MGNLLLGYSTCIFLYFIIFNIHWQKGANSDLIVTCLAFSEHPNVKWYVFLTFPAAFEEFKSQMQDHLSQVEERMILLKAENRTLKGNA